MRRGAAPLLALLVLMLGTAPAGAQVPEPLPADPERPPLTPGCRIGPSLLSAGSTALGVPHRGRLAGGVPFPAETSYAFTWEFPRAASPSRAWRRWGTEKLVLTLQCVLARLDLAHPLGQRLGVADLSRPRGGRFGREFGGLGHASHQNGLDADVLYPRRDGAEEPPRTWREIDVDRAQELVDAFVAAGAQYVFVSPALWRRGLLRGPPAIVQPLVFHDDHVHVRVRP
jgi:murein endopeptidase